MVLTVRAYGLHRSGGFVAVIVRGVDGLSNAGKYSERGNGHHHGGGYQLDHLNRLLLLLDAEGRSLPEWFYGAFESGFGR